MATTQGAKTTGAAAGSAAPPSQSDGGLHINADSGLCTDYLNHFNEAIMLLEMLPAVPESIEDFLAWQPRSYSEHFAASNFKNREAVIAAYHATNPAARKSLDALTDSMNVMLVATRDAMNARSTGASNEALAQCALGWLKPLVARAGYLINRNELPQISQTETSTPQAAIDALLKR